MPWEKVKQEDDRTGFLGFLFLFFRFLVFNFFYCCKENRFKGVGAGTPD